MSLKDENWLEQEMRSPLKIDLKLTEVDGMNEHSEDLDDQAASHG